MTETQTAPEQAPERATRRRQRFVLLIVAGVFAALTLVALAFLGGRLVGQTSAWDVTPGQPVTVTVEPGASATSIYRLLHDAGVARSGALQAAAQSTGAEDRLQAGTYELATDMDPEQVIAQLISGSNSTEANTFTLVEGWTVERIVDELAARTGRAQEEFLGPLREGRVTSAYLPSPDPEVDQVRRWEGLLYPATYVLPSDGDPLEILGGMADEASRRFDAMDWSRIDQLGVTRYEALVIASLVEREAGTDDERDEIASVIYNRLDEEMRLQIDATVIYALGYNPGRVTAADLEVVSPYNTYRVDGLPPTPIGAPSIRSVESALDPAATPFLFYVLGSSDGSHLFATTYEEHQANIATASENGLRP